MDFPDFKAMVEKDYERLCGRLGVAPLPLDIYIPAPITKPEDCDPRLVAKTALGTPVTNGTPGYTRDRIVLPVLRQQVDDASVQEAAFPPSDWRAPIWPSWRIDVWHEARHQVQDQLLGEFEPNDREGHGRGWREANRHLARAFDITDEEAEALL